MFASIQGMLKKAASLRQGYGRQASDSMPAEAASRRQVAILPCSRTMSTLRASKGLRPFLRLRSGQDWTDFFEHPPPLTIRGSSRACTGHWSDNIQQAHTMRDQSGFFTCSGTLHGRVGRDSFYPSQHD